MTNTEQILRDFIFWDCPLASHPRVRAEIRFIEGDFLRLAAHTGFQAPPPACMEITSHGKGLASYLLEPAKNEAMTAFAVTRPFSPRPRFPEGELVGAYLGVPIRRKAGGAVAGLISIATPHDIPFEDRRVGEATTLAAMVSYIEFHLQQREVRPTELSRQLGDALGRVRRDLGWSRPELADRAAGSAAAVSRWEEGTEAPAHEPFVRWCRALGLLSPDTPSIVTLSDVTPQLLRILHAEPERLMELSPEGFEVLVAERLDRAGFAVQRTGSTHARDGGIDLIAVPRAVPIASHLLAVQIKHHAGMRKTGREAVDRLLSWRGNPFNAGLLVTNTAFTRDALWAASREPARNFLHLRDLQDLRRWMGGQFWSESEWRELPDEVELAPGVTIRVPRPRLEEVLNVWPAPDAGGGWE